MTTREFGLTTLPESVANVIARREGKSFLDRPTRSRSPETAMTSTNTLSGRDRAILRAVAAGGAELCLGTEPDLFLDGRCCCDQSAAHRLVRAGLIAATTLKLVGERVAAALTPAGRPSASPEPEHDRSTDRVRPDRRTSPPGTGRLPP